MSDFWSNAAANLVGTFTGAGLALASSLGIQRNLRQRNDRRLVQSVIDRLSRSRVFTHSEREYSGPLSREEEEDLRRSTASILLSREHISHVLSTLNAANRAVPILEQMHAACALYLRSVEEYPNDYVMAIIDLRDILSGLALELCDLNTRLTLRKPGEDAFLVN